MPTQVRNLFRSIKTLALPRFTIRTPKEIQKEIFSKSVWLGSILALVTVAFILMAPYVYTYIFPRYIDAVAYSQVYALMILAAVAQLPLTALIAHGAIKELYNSNVYSSIAMGIVLCGTVYFYGIWGVIITRVAFKYIDVLLAYYFFNRFVKRSSI